MRLSTFIMVTVALGVLASQSTIQAQSYNNSGYSSGQSGSTLGRPGMFGNQGMGGLGSRFSSNNSAFGNNMRRPGSNFESNSSLNRNLQPEGLGNLSQQMMPGSGYSPFSMYPGGTWPGSRRPDRGQSSGTVQQTSPVRIEYRPAFDYPEPGEEQISRSLMQRLANMSALQTASPIEVEICRRTVILRGIVTAQYDRMLAEQIIRLEPGIEEVKNELVVAEAVTSDPVMP